MNPTQHLRIYDAAIAQMVAQKSLILKQEYMDAAISAEGLSRSELTAQAREILRQSAGTLGRDEIEALLALVGDLSEVDDGVTILNNLLLSKNHVRHEDIVRDLQAAADPSSIPSLVATIESDFGYLAWDEGKSLARKCFWALGAIGTDDAWHLIGRYSDSEDPTIAQWANEQLERRRA